MSRLLDTHNPPIGLEPWKNVAPGLVPVWCTIASRKSSPFLSASSFPSGQLITCLLWSMKRMILSPAPRHSLICFTKCLQNRTRGQVWSFFFVMKYCCCYWYVVPKFTFLFLQGLYDVITCVLCPFVQLNSIQLHLPKPLLSCPVFYVSGRLAEAYSPCASFLNPTHNFGFMDVMLPCMQVCVGTFALGHFYSLCA